MQFMGVLGALALYGILVSAIWNATGNPPDQAGGWWSALFHAPTWGAVGPDFGTVKGVAQVLFTSYLLPFEATSLLLLVAIVGAVVVAKERI
jgi:NADH-quinone oxidoreductase subunit J